jgi:hypothetical protein|tara:strand:- start:47 stop:352 length:306 start_codon:yes stop_codon:yes gene_type:complete
MVHPVEQAVAAVVDQLVKALSELVVNQARDFHKADLEQDFLEVSEEMAQLHLVTEMPMLEQVQETGQVAGAAAQDHQAAPITLMQDTILILVSQDAKVVMA